MDNMTITIPLGLAHSVIARLVSLGIKFSYEYKFSVDHVTVDKQHVAAVSQMIAALQELP